MLRLVTEEEKNRQEFINCVQETTIKVKDLMKLLTYCWEDSMVVIKGTLKLPTH